MEASIQALGGIFNIYSLNKIFEWRHGLKLISMLRTEPTDKLQLRTKGLQKRANMSRTV